MGRAFVAYSYTEGVFVDTQDDRAYRYIAIDLKSFYASVECADRGLDPFTADLVVADPTRGEGSICLAVSPALKAKGCPARPRVRDIPHHLSYLMIRPRMRRYMEVSAQVVSIYLRWFAPEDIHVYSIDECFIDVAPYMRLYRKTARELAWILMACVLRETGVSATAGIGTNLFLSKLALDLFAKHETDQTSILDERSFQRRVWHYRPITDIWGIASGTARRLMRWGVQDLWGITCIPRAELRSEFGVKADTLLDHAWGRESCTLHDIKSYTTRNRSISTSQVLTRDYRAEEARIVLEEMCNSAVLDLIERDCACQGVSLWCGYAWQDAHALSWSASASHKLPFPTNSRKLLWEETSYLWDTMVDAKRPIRRLSIALSGLTDARQSQATLFGSGAHQVQEHKIAHAELAVRERFGKTAVFRGIDLRPAATGRARAHQVGGHRG